MASELDIIDDKDLEAPLQLAKNYNQLADEFERVAGSATKVSKSLEDGTTSTKDAREASTQLGKAQKDLDKANEKAAASQKKYAEATAFADQQTGGMISRIKDLSKQFITLLANPVGAFFLLIAGALASITTYFKTTNDGADKFEKIMNALGGIADFFQQKLAKLGEQLVKLFEDGNAFGKVFSFIFDQIINRIAGAIDAFTSLITIINILSKYNIKDLFTGNLEPEDLKALRDEFKNLGKAAISAYTGIGTAADEAAEKIKSLNALTESADKLGDETRDRILSKAKAELEISKLLFDVKDKGNKTDAERLESLQKAVAISEEQSKIETDLAQRRERQFTAELLHRTGIINSNEEANRILEHGTTLLQDQLLEHKAIDSELEERRKLQAATLDAQRAFFDENKKNAAQIAALQKEIDDEAIKRAEHQRDLRVSALDESLKKTEEVSGLEIMGLKGNLAEREQLTKNFNQRLVDETKERLKQQEEAEKEAAKRELDFLRQKEMERRAITQASLEAAAMIGNEFFAREQEKLNTQSATIEENRKKELEGAGDDATKKLAINRKFDREQAKIKQKQAQADKQNALFNILISTAMGIARVAPNPVLIALVAAIGAVQAGLVASRPLPKFASGSEHTPANFIAGERGRELVQHNGKSIIVDKPTIFAGMEGAKVFTNRQTEEILGNMSDVSGALNYGSRIKPQIASSSIIADRMAESNRLLKRIAYKPDVSLVIDSDGFHTYSGRVAKRNKMLDRYFYGR